MAILQRKASFATVSPKQHKHVWISTHLVCRHFAEVTVQKTLNYCLAMMQTNLEHFEKEVDFAGRREEDARRLGLIWPRRAVILAALPWTRNGNKCCTKRWTATTSLLLQPCGPCLMPKHRHGGDQVWASKKTRRKEIRFLPL
eukprot:815476-Amphidinium_carterae.1